MTDVITGEPIVVSTDGDAGPYIMVPVSQLPEVEALLDARRVSFWVDDDAIELDGRPAVAVINLGSSVNPDRIRDILAARP